MKNNFSIILHNILLAYSTKIKYLAICTRFSLKLLNGFNSSFHLFIVFHEKGIIYGYLRRKKKQLSERYLRVLYVNSLQFLTQSLISKTTHSIDKRYFLRERIWTWFIPKIFNSILAIIIFKFCAISLRLYEWYLNIS